MNWRYRETADVPLGLPTCKLSENRLSQKPVHLLGDLCNLGQDMLCSTEENKTVERDDFVTCNKVLG